MQVIGESIAPESCYSCQVFTCICMPIQIYQRWTCIQTYSLALLVLNI